MTNRPSRYLFCFPMSTMESTADALARDAGFFSLNSGSLTTRLRPLYFHMNFWFMPFPSGQKGYSLAGKNFAKLFFKTEIELT